MKEIQLFEIPIFFLVGKYDMITPAILVDNFYNALDARMGKALFIFENSAHFLMVEENEKYEDYLINTVLKTSQGC